MPVMWPGFSWFNLKSRASGSQNHDKVTSPEFNKIPRLGGRFMWAQAHQFVADANIKTIWMAMFDEVDEVRFQLCA